MSQQTEIGIIIKAFDQATGVFRKISKSLHEPKLAAEKLGKAFSNVTKEVGLLGVKMGALAVGAGYLFKSQFIDTAAQFEKFQAILETVEGSSLKAQKSMDWVSDFATKTPYELNEVMDAFVKLRSYGFNPTNGLLKSLGDTGSAMGKPIMQAVEAVADAVNGENERLKEFGIRAKVVGDKIAYEYSHNGKTMVKTADKNSREMIEATLTGIFNQKFAGAMDKQSKTWAGLISNIADQWTRFKMMTMNAGVFDYLKNKLSALLDKVNEMANSGKLQELAEIFGKKLVRGFETLYSAGVKLWPELVKMGKTINDLANFVGGYQNLFIGFAAFMAGPAVMSFIALTKAVWGFTAALFANPIGAWIGGIAIAVGLGVLLYNKWKPFRDLINFIGKHILIMLGPIGMLIQLGITVYKNWKPWMDGLAQVSGIVGNIGKALGGTAPKVEGQIPAAKSAGPVPSLDVGSKGITRTGLALVHKGEKITPAGMSGNSYNVSYNPHFTINGVDAGSVDKIKQVVKQSFAECMRDFQHNQARRAF